jgi:glycosyltransferase involved in cell wall biosynthesis
MAGRCQHGWSGQVARRYSRDLTVWMMIPVKLSLVIPCYNEAANLPLLVERCRPLVAAGDIEVVLVDNGSTDNSSAVMTALLDGLDGVRSIRVKQNRGYGFGILSGLRAASGDVLAWTHADLQTNPLDAETAFAMFRANSHPQTLFVKGSRYGRPALDRVFTAGMSTFETLLTGKAMCDINAQPTMFHRDFFSVWQSPPDDFSLDLYAYWLAKRCRLAVRRFPVLFGARAHGVSHWNTGMAARVKFIRRTVAFSLKLRKTLAF